MKNRFFVTGIGTEVGKTIAAAIITEALEADYWKPVQAGDLQNSDTHKVKKLISNKKTIFHPNAVALRTPMSPHAAAGIEGVKIDLEDFEEPETPNVLVVEGAGGLMVPLNDTHCIIDLIHPDDKVILVSRHYLGSINHTLLSVEALKHRNLNCFGIIFSGEENPSSEEIIGKIAGLNVIGRIEEEPYFDQMVVREYAEKFRNKLMGDNE